MPSAPTPRLSKLNRAEQDVFLLQHIPHRLCAASTWLKLPHRWIMPKEPDLPKNHFHVWCTGRSVDEGRYAAMRWLTEFVGVKMAWVGRRGVRPKVPKDHPDQMVTIRRFNGGRFFPLGTRHSLPASGKVAPKPVSIRPATPITRTSARGLWPRG